VPAVTHGAGAYRPRDLLAQREDGPLVIVFAAMQVHWLDVQDLVAAEIGIRAFCLDVPLDLCQYAVDIDEFLFLHFLINCAPERLIIVAVNVVYTYWSGNRLILMLLPGYRMPVARPEKKGSE